MGVNLKDLFEREEIIIDSLAGKTLAIDAYNMLYQFLTTIRTPDGQLLTNNAGAVTSHIIGLFSRTTNLLSKNIKLIFVFDGKPPTLKLHELHRRAEAKKTAQQHYEKAAKEKDIPTMKKYASRTTRLDNNMVADAKKLLQLLGIPVIQAPSEGEAQCAHIVKKGQAWAVASQDYDSLIQGTPRLIQNLTLAGKRKIRGTLSTTTIQPSMILLQENLQRLHLTQEQLIYLAMLVGTDYNIGGIHGIGPKKALTLVKKHHTPEALFKAAEWNNHFELPWKELFHAIKNTTVTNDYTLTPTTPDTEKLTTFLVDNNNFSLERVQKSLQPLQKKQTGLNQFFT